MNNYNCTCNTIKAGEKCRKCKCRYRTGICDHCYSTEETRKIINFIISFERKTNDGQINLFDLIYSVGKIQKTKYLYDILLKLVAELFYDGYIIYEDNMLLSKIELNHDVIPDNTSSYKNLKDNFYVILTAVIISPCAHFDYNPETNTFKQRKDALEHSFNK